MIILVDAYNVLKSALRTVFINDQQRKNFINKMKSYAKTKKHHIIIVFDGGLYKWPLVSKEKNSTIVYAGSGGSADDYIKDYLEGHHTKNIVLVSSDNELYASARQFNIPTIDSAVFYTMVYESLGEKAVKTSKLSVIKAYKYSNKESNYELDCLMESTTVKIKNEDEYAIDNNNNNNKAHEKISSKQKLSKWEKKLLKLVKKL